MDVTVIKSNRKTVGIQVNADLSVTVRVPRKISSKDIERILKEKEPWLRKHIEQIRRQIQQYESMEIQKLTNEQIQKLMEKACKYIPERVSYYAKQVGVTYGRITIRKQKTRWGSCSSKGNLNFNYLLMLTPPEVLDYVIVHELCHRKEMNHSKAFWNEIEKIFPNYRESVKWLKEEGKYLIRRQNGEGKE